MKYKIEDIAKSFAAEDYQLISTTYIDNKHKLFYICPEGHKHEMRWSDWLNKGVRCPYCNGRPIYKIEDVRKAFSTEGYTLLTKEYINNKQKLAYLCPKGHKHSISFSSWLRGRRCYLCNGNVKKDFADIKTFLKIEGYELLSNKYVGCQNHLQTVCPAGHEYTMTWDNWSSKNSRCPKCGEVGVSKEELSLYEFLLKHVSVDIHTKNRQICKPKELDFVIPNKNIAIEYSGLYWHSEFMGKNSNYHVDKLIKCQAKNYKLITVFSDELKYKHDICLSRLLSYIDSSSFTKIYARNCIIKEILPKQARAFCEANHLQGYGSGASAKLGLFYNEELVAVMTFSKPSLAKGHKKSALGVWELHRFCSKINTTVVGGASKLLKYFERNYEWKELFSYADRRWSIGNLYENLGFIYSRATKPNYWYLKGPCFERINRFSLRKRPDEPKDTSEWELRKAQGYNRVWDCGNLKYIKYNKE